MGVGEHNKKTNFSYMTADDVSRIQSMFYQQIDRLKVIRNLIKTTQMCKN